MPKRPQHATAAAAGLAEVPAVTEIAGFWHAVPVLQVDGLCVALAGDDTDIGHACADVAAAMRSAHAASGTVLIAPGRAHGFTPERRRELADLGIAIVPAAGGDLRAAAQALIDDYWRLRREQREHLLAFAAAARRR